VFRRRVLAGMRLEQDRFGFEPEVTVKSAFGGLHIAEAPISYSARTHGQGKKIGWRDGLKAVWCIAWYALRGAAGT